MGDASTDAWATSLDRIEELCDMGDYRAADEALVAVIGATVIFHGREFDVAALLAGRLVEAIDTARHKSRGWRGGQFVGATWEEWSS